MLQPTRWNPAVDTDFANNVRRVRPFLGILLVGAVGLYFAHVLYKSVSDLTVVLEPTDALGVTGTLVLTSPADPTYGNLLTFSLSLDDASSDTAQSYITVMCFQDKKLVYQVSAQPGVKFLLTDPVDPRLEWDGGAASCNASLIYRVPSGTRAELYMLDSISFEVTARS